MKISTMIISLGAALAIAAPNPMPNPVAEAAKPVHSVTKMAWKRAAEPDPVAAAAYPVHSVSKMAWKRHVERDAEPEAEPEPAAASMPEAVSDTEYVKRQLAEREAAAAAGPAKPIHSVSHMAWKRTSKREAEPEPAAEPMLEMGPEPFEVLTA